MISPRDRAAVTALLKKRGAKARRGHLRLAVGDLYWYVVLRASGAGAAASWTLEIGCWVPELTPEPEGGAIDCPLLLDVAVGGDQDVVAAAEAVVDGLAAVGTLGELPAWIAAHPSALVDRVLRDRLEAR
ncbi:hypothetical protein GCM10022215_40690 [Nocardioides fonticola]|uniref:Uncharacterized protein n=1 Tax=Nocardioides fonticola TaxID=450363 RepID=A0ABP7Y0F9_9ACTN